MMQKLTQKRAKIPPRLKNFRSAKIPFSKIKTHKIDVFATKLLRIYIHKSVWDVFVLKD